MLGGTKRSTLSAITLEKEKLEICPRDESLAETNLISHGNQFLDIFSSG